MPKDTSIRKVLLIGSGPIVIGQACEFDYSGTQALRTLRSEGYKVILANSNPATIMTDPELADRTYIEPLTHEFLERIIETEKPDALLPTMGGQTALNLAVTLAESGVLKKHGVRMLGANLESIKKAEDRQLFKKTMEDLGIEVAKSRQVHNIDEGKEALADIGLPIILRPSFTLGGEGGGIASTESEFFAILERGLFLSPTHSVLVEESLVGWKEYELEVVRDRADNVIIVCSIENVDPMGIHTGDSITVAPAQTLSDRQYQHLRDLSKKIIRAIGVETGGSNIQFAVNPRNGRTVVIEMNPRVSRSSALASKATGFPIAKVATRLAIGYTLDEVMNDITGTTPASFEPTIDYVVTKIPRFDFQKFTATPPLLGTQMKSVGESMAIGRTFKESFFKALAGMENGHTDLSDISTGGEDLDAILRKPIWTRLFYVATALRRGYAPERIHELTGIDSWFIRQLGEAVALEKHFQENKMPLSKWSDHELQTAKEFGFTDHMIAKLTGASSIEVTRERISRGIMPTYLQVDTCAGEFEARTPYLYSTYGVQQSTAKAMNPEVLSKGVMILGSGPNRIGQGIEFDYCCVHASEAAREMGYKSIMVNYNPETVSTDYDVSSRLFFEPLTVEHVLNIQNFEKNIQGSIVQFGGQTPLKISSDLIENGHAVLGTSVDSIDIAEDRERFEQLMRQLKFPNLKQAPSITARSAEEALEAAKAMGFPVMLRPSYVLGGRGMKIIFSEDSFRKYIHEAIQVSDRKPVLIDRFLSNAIEVDVDAISDGRDVLIGGILEHIEEAGIHSGDSACSIPCITLTSDIQNRLREYSRGLAQKLKVIGLINIQFAVQGKDIYVLEVNPRASRTVPFLSKAVGAPLAKIATKVMLGQSLADQGYTKDFDLGLDVYNVKMPVFPFHKFPGVDVILGPEMKSTGESMGRAKGFPAAYAKALLGAGVTIPKKGLVLISIADEDKGQTIIEIARMLQKLDFEIECTPGTLRHLNAAGIQCEVVHKVGNGDPVTNCVARVKQGKYNFIINTTNDEKAILDSYSIRRTALEKKIPYCTLVTTAKAFVQAIESVKLSNLELMPLQ